MNTLHDLHIAILHST